MNIVGDTSSRARLILGVGPTVTEVRLKWNPQAKRIAMGRVH